MPLLSIIGRGWASKSAIALNISQLCLSPVVNLFLDWNPVHFQKGSFLKTQRSCHITLKGHCTNWLKRCLDQRSGKISLKDQHHLRLSFACALSSILILIYNAPPVTFACHYSKLSRWKCPLTHWSSQVFPCHALWVTFDNSPRRSGCPQASKYEWLA